MKNFMEFWLPIIIPSIVSIIGFSVTIFTTFKQFKNSKKERIIEKQSILYLECYNKIERIINSLQIIFDKSYYNSILLFKAEMKLNASNSTLRMYKAYLKFVFDTWEEYNAFCTKNDPHLNKNNIEVVTNEDTGKENEIWHISESDITRFNNLLEQYKKEHCPNINEIKKHIAKLLNSMRKDLSNEPIEMDIIE